MRDCLEVINEMRIPIREIRLSGGGARSDFWRQMQADVLGKTVVTMAADEGPAGGDVVAREVAEVSTCPPDGIVERGEPARPPRINLHARIVICGAISQYNNTTPVKGPSNYMMLLVARARMQGMVVFDYADRYGVAVKDIAQWMKEGKFISREDIVPGIENFPATMNKLFSGENFGKLVLKVTD